MLPRVALPVLSLLLLSAVRPASAQSGLTGAAGALQELAASRPRIEILARGGLSFDGRLVEASGSSVVVETKTGRHTFAVEDVDTIWRSGRTRWWKGAMIGAGVGAGLIGLAKAGEGDCGDPASLCATDGPVTASDAVYLAATGAAAGAYVAWTRRVPRHPVYISERSFPADDDVSRETVPPPWTALAARLPIGSRIEVRQRSTGPVVRGTLVAITPAGIRMFVDGGPYLIPRPDVRGIWTPRLSYWRALSGMLLPLTSGGLIAGAVICRDDDACYDRYLPWAMGVGVGLSAASVFVANRRALVYDADKPPHAARLAIAPVLGRGRAALQVRIRF